jgi:hypothetical protein
MSISTVTRRAVTPSIAYVVAFASMAGTLPPAGLQFKTEKRNLATKSQTIQ